MKKLQLKDRGAQRGVNSMRIFVPPFFFCETGGWYLLLSVGYGCVFKLLGVLARMGVYIIAT